MFCAARTSKLAACVYTTAAWDTFSPSAPNILPAIDEALHLYAKTLDPAWRKLIAGGLC